uniref:Uncharacterized protein n=1 Tax=Clastoptera arizonana TaxID=38151 RepID=A0A1B6DP97_9HEMI
MLYENLYIILSFLLVLVIGNIDDLPENLNNDTRHQEDAHRIYNRCNEVRNESVDPLKHLELLNSQILFLLTTIKDPSKLDKETYEMAKIVLTYANVQLTNRKVDEVKLKYMYDFDDKQCEEFVKLYNETKKNVNSLNILFGRKTIE